MTARFAPFFYHRHPLPIRRVSPNGRIDGPSVGGHLSMDDGHVLPLNGMFGQLLGQVHMGRIMLGHHQQTGGIFVDPVHDAGAQDAVNA